MSRRPIHALFLLVLLLSCSHKRELDREKAQDLLSKSDAFSKPTTVTIALGSDFRQVDFIGLVNWGVADQLVADGYLTWGNREFRVVSAHQAEVDRWGRDPERP